MMRKIILDGEKINSINEFHLFFKKELEFPDYYGMNLNAFWDCLTEGFEITTKIVWVNIEDSKKKLGEDCVNAVLDIFEKGKEYMKSYSEKFDYEIR